VLADTVREARRKKGFSVLHLSKRSGVSWSIIRQIKSGSPSYVPSESNTSLLAQALRVPVGSLLSERDRSVELLRHRSYEATKESRGAST
jgi:transcriptional regulator with XRE-family HTH domain